MVDAGTEEADVGLAGELQDGRVTRRRVWLPRAPRVAETTDMETEVLRDAARDIA